MNISPSGKQQKINLLHLFWKEFGETAVADINGDDVEIATSDRELNVFIFDINGTIFPDGC